jgi:metal-sulfur cluster biosynthetic enzyme
MSPTAGSAELEARVRRALDEVRDPCSVAAGVPAGIAEMGLVRSLEISQGPDGARVRVAIGVTEPTCLMGPSFLTGARERLAREPGIARVDVELSADADWSPIDMSPDYRERLAAHRRARRGAIDVVVTPRGGVVKSSSREASASREGGR